MSKLLAVSPENLLGKFWRKGGGYKHASNVVLAPIIAPEAPVAAMALPLGFAPQGAEFALVAVLGLIPGQDLLVAPDGQWLAGYIPAALRSFPFQIAADADGKAILCVDADSVLDRPEGDAEPFFDDKDTLGSSVKAILAFLSGQIGNIAPTQQICRDLQGAGVIVPWEIQVQTDDQKRKIEGIYKIDEDALNALSDQQFLSLRASRALQVAYCQLLSMQNLAMLGQMAQAQAAAKIRREQAAKEKMVKQATLSGDIDLSILTKHR